MKTTKLLERIEARTKRIQEEKVENFWNDFLQSVEKVSNKLSDEKLSETVQITIQYCLQDGEVFRIQSALVSNCYDSIDVDYEEENICLGAAENLALTFSIFIREISEEENIKTEGFDGFFDNCEGAIYAYVDFVLHN